VLHTHTHIYIYIYIYIYDISSLRFKDGVDIPHIFTYHRGTLFE